MAGKLGLATALIIVLLVAALAHVHAATYRAEDVAPECNDPGKRLADLAVLIDQETEKVFGRIGKNAIQTPPNALVIRFVDYADLYFLHTQYRITLHETLSCLLRIVHRNRPIGSSDLM